MRHPDAAECIRCGECVTACPKGAISMKADLIVPWTKSHSSMRQKQE
ncbi:MAG: 4Fe-4S binding protein [Selenomonadaceae bacterium]|nr:4Fe-4S binding protein [Selenomonadaceae bacterium]